MITLVNLSQASAQDVFDQVTKHLLDQKMVSKPYFGDDVSLSDGCLYRGPRGLKCAAGCLIADNEYKPEFEGKTWDELVELKMVPDGYENLIRDLQYVHDNYHVNSWYAALKEVAYAYQLEFHF